MKQSKKKTRRPFLIIIWIISNVEQWHIFGNLLRPPVRPSQPGQRLLQVRPSGGHHAADDGAAALHLPGVVGRVGADLVRGVDALEGAEEQRFS